MDQHCPAQPEVPTNQPDRGTKLTPGDTLHGKNTTYRVVRFLDEGGFGEVVECRINDTKDSVAVKILKNPQAILEAECEINILGVISELDTELLNLVKFIEHFKYRGYTCLVFEMLDISLWDFVIRNGPMTILEARRVAQQLLVALDALKELSIIHTDLKPDNVMLVNRQLKPLSVKLIDFGLAKPTSVVRKGMCVQPPEYRAMEVRLGCTYDCAIDMWSLGCILFFVVTGQHLFSEYNYQAVKLTVDKLGMPPVCMIVSGYYSADYFSTDSQCKATLRTASKFRQFTGGRPGRPSVFQKHLKTRHDFIKVMRRIDKVGFRGDSLAFLDFLKGLMAVDPKLRLTPKEALKHPFITMTHLSDFSDYFSDAKKEMQINDPGESETQPTPLDDIPISDEDLETAGHLSDIADSLDATTKPQPCAQETIPIFKPELRAMCAAAEISAGRGFYVPLAVDVAKNLHALTEKFTEKLSTWFYW